MKRTQLFMLTLVIHAVGAWGADLFVNTTSPAMADDRRCSLAEAIINANADEAVHRDCPAGSGADVIHLEQNSTYVLDEIRSVWAGPNGLPLVESEIRIEGHGSTIRRDTGCGRLFRLFAATFQASLELVDLTLSDGNPGGDNTGGALMSSGTTRLVRTTITRNRSRCGGGVHNRSGTMWIIDSVVTQNTGHNGGGICSDAVYGDALLFVERTAVNDNHSNGDGGGVHCVKAEGRKAYLELVDSVVSNNSAVDSAGGITADARAFLRNTTVSDNSASMGGGIFLRKDEAELDRCTISGNSAETTLAVGGSGAGILVVDGILTMTNSTVSRNHANGAGSTADGSGQGGGLQMVGRSSQTLAMISSSTIFHNSAESNGGGISVRRQFDWSNLEVTLHNTVVGSNLELGRTVLGSCIADAPAVITSLGFNVTDDHTCFLDSETDLVVNDVMLGPLGAHGGPTRTHLPLEGSPAIDSGDDSLCSAMDQRGASRPLDGNGDGSARCDRGSVELGTLFMDGFESGDASGWSAAVP